MRYCIPALLALCLVAPSAALAQGTPSSSVQLAHSVLKPGQTQSLTVVARDLQGNPLIDASVVATVHYGSRAATYRMPVTDKHGKSSITFRTPTGIRASTAVVSVDVSNGYLDVSLNASFKLAGASRSGSTARPGKSHGNARLIIVARALPPTVTAPQPVWIVVYVHNNAGTDLKNAPVDAAAVFKGSTKRADGRTDGYGVATIRIDTSVATANQTVQVGIVAHSGSLVASSTAQFSVRLAPKPAATATPTVTPVPTSTPVPTPTASSTPTPTSAPSSTSGLFESSFTAPTATDAPAYGMVIPTWTPPPTSEPPTPTSTPVVTAVPTDTSTPVATDPPTPTVTPTSTPVPTATPMPTSTPTVTSTPLPTCPGSDAGCVQAELNLINSSRAEHNLPTYTLDMTESNGTGSCIGSIGHSEHMAETGVMAHDQFPADICGSYHTAGENIGYWASGNELTDLENIHAEMMSEPWTPGCQGSHSCNILSSAFTRVGIGIVVKNGTTWLTTDFLG